LKIIIVSEDNIIVRQSLKYSNKKTRCTNIRVNHDGQLILLVLIVFDSINFHWLYRPREIMAILVSYWVVYDRKTYQLNGISSFPC